jgi:hypothetical protein
VTTRMTWPRPFLGGTKRSTRSVNRMSPTRSLFLMALNASSAAISATVSILGLPTVPNFSEAERSTRSITVISRSSVNIFTYASFMRALTFQSMKRTSSPAWYWRTSLNAMPRPLKTEW